MFGITNSSKGTQDAATVAYVDAQIAAHHGYPLKTSEGALIWNMEVRLGSISSNQTVTLPAPAQNPTQTEEIRITAYCAAACGIKVQMTSGTGYEIYWAEKDEPTSLRPGYVCEISLSPLDNSRIIGYYRETFIQAV